MSEPTPQAGEPDPQTPTPSWHPDDADRGRRIEAMPKEVGVLLLVVGVGGILLPGPVGSPFLLLGGVILWPRAFRGVEDWFARRFPRTHQESMRQVVRYLNDLERRYPLKP